MCGLYILQSFVAATSHQASEMRINELWLVYVWFLCKMASLAIMELVEETYYTLKIMLFTDTETCLNSMDKCL
ncbi:hypothetical protein EPI10_025718 [Gossypium australe]|uniref:Uncharacterized protein n=1 Tax=Gossypium australe TaxID=47621 RepID=A0A5B6W1U0_9ROSI|nr:hypothetical protein EPI10_025718 [Gossypium australe]